MGAPESGMHAAEQGAAETLLTALRTIKAAERAKHASVLDYWLSIRGDKEFPPLHDLDPLEISDAGSSSILLELIGGGQDAEIRHLGEALKEDVAIERIIDAPNPSILTSIARKLPIVAISRDFLAFEDSFDSAGGWTRCWVTLLPLSSCGSWVDYVYAFVSVETGGGKVAKAPEPIVPADVPPEEVTADEVVEEGAEAVTDATMDDPEPAAPETAADVVPFVAEEPEATPEVAAEPVEEAPAAKPGFAKLLDGFANLAGFYGQGVKADPVVTVELPTEEPVADEVALAIEPEAGKPPSGEPDAVDAAAELEEAAAELVAPEPVATEPLAEPEEAALELVEPEPAAPEPVTIEQPVDEAPVEVEPEPAPEAIAPETAPAMEGTLQSKLDEVQAKAGEAREAQLRATAALHEGLSAAYDFALDAESSPEEYLRMVEAQGMKIQLRAPMAPVAKLAFDGVCDPATIRQFEAVLAWALKVELPRGALLERIEGAGGVPELLSEFSRAA